MTGPTLVSDPPNAEAASSAEPILARLEAGTFQVFHVAAAELRKLLASTEEFTSARVARIRYWVTEVEHMPGDAAKEIAKELRAWADGLEPAAPATPSVTAVHTVTSAPVIPLPVASTHGITVSWPAVEEATGYRLDVSTDPEFGAFVRGYQDLDVGGVTEHLVPDLTAGTKYYIRVRAVGPTGTSANSNTVEVETPALPAPATPGPTAGAPAALTLSVSPAFLTLGIGHSSTLDATASDPSALITFDSSDTRVATVSPSSGLVTGIAAGSATITARSGAVSAACSVSVT